MAKKLFVGSVAYSTTEEGLRAAFAPFGTVETATIIMDRMSGRSKGFGFVEMSTEEEAQAAVEGMNGQNLDGRKIIVSEARPPKPREGGGSYGNRSGGSRGYGSRDSEF